MAQLYSSISGEHSRNITSNSYTATIVDVEPNGAEGAEVSSFSIEYRYTINLTHQP